MAPLPWGRNACLLLLAVTSRLAFTGAGIFFGMTMETSYCYVTAEDLEIFRRMSMHELGQYVDADLRDLMAMIALTTASRLNAMGVTKLISREKAA